MKAKLHPKWFDECKVSCACGNTMTIGATVSELTIDVCSGCHPFFTGKMKFVDAAGRVEAFRAKQKGAKGKRNISKADKRKAKRAKKLQEELGRPDTLEQVRKQTKKKDG